MKILSKVKSVIIGIGIGILTFAYKVFALSPMDIDMNEIGAVTMYGVPKPSPIRTILRIAKVFIIPLIVIVGLLIYLKKSKSSKKKKLLVTLGVVAITAMLYWIVSKIIYELF